MNQDEQWLLDEKYSGVATPEFEEDKHRLAGGEPVAYVIGWQPFLGLKICLDSHPLIPRPETEWWVAELIGVMRKVWPAKRSEDRRPEGFSKGDKEFRFLDLCAGSGAIGCAVLKALPNAEVYFGEVDPAHELTILKNIRENNLDESRAHLGIGDLFAPFGDMTFDLIATNPPYIPSDRVLEASVVGYEPALALFSGSDGLDLIRRIATELPKRLNKGGQAWIECDSAHIEIAKKLFETTGMVAEIRTDQYAKPRLLVVSYPL